MRRAIIASVAIVAAVFMASVAYVADGMTESIERADANEAALRRIAVETKAQLADQQAKTALLADQVRDLGEEPIVTPSVPIPTPTSTTPPSPAQLMTYARQALADFCAGGRCEPKDGKDGATGSDSTVPGPEGPQGPAGADGRDGEDGRGVRSVECTDDGWVVTYTDDSTSNAGQCRPNGPLA